jgi:hypothetical protein
MMRTTTEHEAASGAAIRFIQKLPEACRQVFGESAPQACLTRAAALHGWYHENTELRPRLVVGVFQYTTPDGRDGYCHPPRGFDVGFVDGRPGTGKEQNAPGVSTLNGHAWLEFQGPDEPEPLLLDPSLAFIPMNASLVGLNGEAVMSELASGRADLTYVRNERATAEITEERLALIAADVSMVRMIAEALASGKAVVMVGADGAEPEAS